MKNFLLTLGLVIITTAGFGQLIGTGKYERTFSQVRVSCEQKNADYYLDDIIFNFIIKHDTLTVEELNGLDTESKKKIFEDYFHHIVRRIVMEALMYMAYDPNEYSAKEFDPREMRIDWDSDEKNYIVFLKGMGWYSNRYYQTVREILHLDIEGNIFIKYPDHPYMSYTREFRNYYESLPDLKDFRMPPPLPKN